MCNSLYHPIYNPTKYVFPIVPKTQKNRESQGILAVHSVKPVFVQRQSSSWRQVREIPRGNHGKIHGKTWEKHGENHGKSSKWKI